MKKQLTLAAMAVLSVTTALTYAAEPMLNLSKVLGKDGTFDFGFTETQNVTVKGFQDMDGTKEFVMTSPLLKDVNDVEVEEYSILIAKKPIASYKAQTTDPLKSDFDESKQSVKAEDKAQNELTLKLSLQANNLDADANYYGVVVPLDDNVQEGTPSKEFCFNFSTEKFAEGAACETFGTAAEISTADGASETTSEEEEHSAAGADMRLAEISHTISKTNLVTLTWKALAQSANVEIQLYDKATDEFIKLATVPMTQEKFEYQAKDTDQELIFTFIPRDEKGKEIRYEVNARTETEMTPEIKEVPKVGPVEDMMLIIAITVLAYAGYRLLATNKVE